MLADLEALYRERFHTYLRVAEGITGELELGLDAVQDGFANAIRHRVDFRGEANLSTWVWRCVVNAAMASRRPRETELGEVKDPTEDRSEGPESDIRTLIAALPDRQRATVFLRYYADLDYRSIADALGVEIGTVGATLARAHESLRRDLKEVRR